MEPIKAKTRSGKEVYRPTMTSEEYGELSEEYTGFCLACGETQEGCEPDARAYECESCGANKVYGLEELMLMGYVKFTDVDANEVNATLHPERG